MAKDLRESDPSVQYYDNNAEDYCASTVQIDMSEIRARFVKYIPAGGRILDAGCGSGRDALAFILEGYSVTAFDASGKMAEFATKYTGQECQVLRFQDVSFDSEFDGVWSCAALLHVSREEMPDVLRRIVRSLRPGGTGYFSFIYGNDERRAADGRFYNSYTVESIHELLESIGDVKLIESWITTNSASSSRSAPWLNVIVRRDSN